MKSLLVVHGGIGNVSCLQTVMRQQPFLKALSVSLVDSCSIFLPKFLSHPLYLLSLLHGSQWPLFSECVSSSRDEWPPVHLSLVCPLPPHDLPMLNHREVTYLVEPSSHTMCLRELFRDSEKKK